MSSLPPMSARGVLVCFVVLGACGGTSQACIDGSQVWAAADIVCVRGDLIVEGRRPDELVLRPGRTDLIELEYDASALLRESPVNLPATAMSVRVPAGRPAPKFCKGTNPLAAEALA